MNLDSSSCRRWYQLHKSSWFILAVAIILMTAVNLPYEYGTVSQSGSDSWFQTDILFAEMRYGGWPRRYLSVRTPKYAESSAFEWSTAALAFDVLVAMVLLAAVVGGYERRRRRRTRRWQLTLGDLSFLMLVICGIFRTWNMMAHHYRNQQHVFQQIRFNGGFVATRLFLPKIVIGPEKRSALRGHFHAWLIDQLWYHERATEATVASLNDEVMAALRRLPSIRTLVVDDPTMTDQTVATLASLDRLERLQIGGEQLTDACVVSLQRLTQLRYLRICDAMLSDEAIAQLTALPNLVSLDVEGTPLTDRGLAAIAACQRLCELNIARTHVSEEGLRVLDGHPKLTRLWLASHVSRQESPAVRRVHLRNLPLLESLHLPSRLDSLELTNLPSLTRLPAEWESSDGLSIDRRFYPGPSRSFWGATPFPRPMLHGVNAMHLSLREMPGLDTLVLDVREIGSLELDLTNLESLSTSSANAWIPYGVTPTQDAIDDRLCEMIGRNKTLRQLALVNATLTHHGWAQLSSLHDLQSLDFTGSNVTDDDLAAFAEANKLKALSLADTQISNDGWDKLPRLARLQSLDLSDTQVARIDLEDLSELHTLAFGDSPIESLRLKNLPQLTGSLFVTPSGPIVFEAVNLPALTAIYLEQACIERMTLDGLRSLDQLDLSGSTVDDAMLRDLGQWTNLTGLALPDTDITDTTLRRIGKLQKLDRLDVENTAITDAGLVAISPQLPLTVLNLTGTNVSDGGLRQLSGQKQLTHLFLGRTKVRGPGLQHLSNVTSLQRLSLGETRVTSESMAHLQKMKRLQWLRLSDTRIDDASFQHLNRLPNLGWLFLNGTSVTDRGVAAFNLPGTLKALDIAKTAVTADGASRIKRANYRVKVNW